MTNGQGKDSSGARAPEGSPAEPAEEELITSEDLFGDMLDEAPRPPAPAPTPAAAPRPTAPKPQFPPRRSPIKVQVSEPGTGTKSGEGGDGEQLPEDIAALLDAFSEPAESAAREAAAAPPPRPAPPAPPAPMPPALPPPPETPRTPRAPTVSGSDFGGVDQLFDALVEPPAEKPTPVPVSFEPRVEPEAMLELDEEEPGPAPGSQPEPMEEDELQLEGEESVDTLLGLPARTPATPPALDELLPPHEDAISSSGTPLPASARRPTSKDADPLAAFLKTLPKRPVKAPALPEEERPTARTGTRFAAAPAQAPPPVSDGLDLAALADAAIGGTAPPAPAAPSAPAPVSPSRPSWSGDFGPYRLLEKIAVGGMAEVFKAKRTGVEGFEKVVAVKRILPHLSDNQEFVDMFVNEAKMVAGLTHPNIVQIFDLGKLEKSYYIAMEYIHGRDLRTILRRGRERGLRLPLDLALLVVSRMGSALEYAHRAKDERGRPMLIVHRDISPQNILISFEGDVKLTDFGIAKAATKAPTTDRGALRGKLLYMSPEQAWGKSMDRRSDLYSLGIVFYEMLTDQKPFLGTSDMSVLEMVREGRVSTPSSVNPKVPERLERVVMKMLEKDPEQRYQDAADLHRDLERVLHERQPPTSANLARYLELLFDGEERGESAPDTSPEEKPAGSGALEMDFDVTLPGARREGQVKAETSERTEGEKDPRDPMSIQSLLKRFGIK